MFWDSTASWDSRIDLIGRVQHFHSMGYFLRDTTVLSFPGFVMQNIKSTGIPTGKDIDEASAEAGQEYFEVWAWGWVPYML